MAYPQQNQFNMQPIVGDLDLRSSKENVIAGVYSAAATAKAVVGTVMRFAASAKSTLPVFEAASNLTTDKIAGVLVYSVRKNEYSPGDKIEVAGFDTCVFLELGEAITAGGSFQFDITKQGVVKAGTATVAHGYVIDGGAIGDVVRCIVRVPKV